MLDTFGCNDDDTDDGDDDDDDTDDYGDDNKNNDDDESGWLWWSISAGGPKEYLPVLRDFIGEDCLPTNYGGNMPALGDI